MPVSQNLRFSAECPKDTVFDYPPGAALMRHFARSVSAAGWQTGELANWRDAGWSISCSRNTNSLQVAFAGSRDGEWMLQISPLRRAGLVRSLFGGKSSATPQEIQDIALVIHRACQQLPSHRDMKWRWDGFPDDSHATSEPQPA